MDKKELEEKLTKSKSIVKAAEAYSDILQSGGRSGEEAGLAFFSFVAGVSWFHHVITLCNSEEETQKFFSRLEQDLALIQLGLKVVLPNDNPSQAENN